MSSTQFAMVEELAFLVKDNLRTKHLVLSMEESFVTFLHNEDEDNPKYSGQFPRNSMASSFLLGLDGVLELEPMDPYSRLLLHRLADIFGFAHASIGEGEDRHLVLERCPETAIPSILVSDILSQYDNEQHAFTTQPELLRRDFPSVIKSNSPSVRTLEEREAAYVAARERIFADDVNGLDEASKQRPRSVPVVARRMIAHALGQKLKTQAGRPIKSNENDSKKESAKSVGSKKEFSKEQQLGAAKRMFANALGLPSSKQMDSAF